MERRKLVAFSETLHKLADSHQDLFGTELARFKRMNAIDSPQQLEQTFQVVQEQNRLMNIGIVGRVKAGKSSLLNALIFDGEPILPKAATPMTAALTTITWGEAFQAKVEFFSEKDISIIKNKAEQYKTRLDKRTQECLEELIKRRSMQQPHGSPISDNKELINMASRRAQSELQREEALFAAYDQYQRMQSSGSARSPQNFQSDIQANNPKELAERLHEYVGAKGEFMPFTKSVHVFMPLEALRDICIIDTPGMNDPVQSREERTVELLKTCDVVFIVSPAGQFLNEQDLEVMGRITQKQGIQELVLIASQVDTQLYGSEKRARLSDALNNIRDQLSVRAQSTLADLKQSNPEVGSVFDNLINSARSNLLHSSGLCHSLNRRFDTPESWDSNEKTTWENLTGNYADYFNRENSTLSLNSLDSLANIAAIKDVLAQVREKKAAIIQDKLANLSMSTRKSLQAFQHQLISLASNQIALIKNADVEQLNAQLNELKYKKSELSYNLDQSFKKSMHQYCSELQTGMEKVAKNQLNNTENEINKKNQVAGERKPENKGGLFNFLAEVLWNGGCEEIDDRQILTSPVVAALELFLTNSQKNLQNIAKQSRLTLNEKLGASLTKEVREILKEDTDPAMLRNAIINVVCAIEQNDVNLDIKLSKEISHRGILKNEEAKIFKDTVDNFVGTLEFEITKVIDKFIKDLGEMIPKSISDAFVVAIEEKINALKDQINHAAQTIDRLERLLRKCEEVTL